MNMNELECIDIYMKRKSNKELESGIKHPKYREFFNECLREIDGADAYDFLVFKASKLLNCKMNHCYRFVNYYFENKEHFDCSFEEWLLGHDGPLVRKSIFGLFPEFELITKDKYKIADMARKYYGIEIYHFDEYDDAVWCISFDFRELNKKRIDLKDIQKKVSEYQDSLISRALKGGE